MEAKDTVISDLEQAELKAFYVKTAITTREDIAAYVVAVKKRQAEVSFKAGVREVVEWIREHSPMLIAGADVFTTVAGHEMRQDITYYPIIKYLDWQAKLKEWGIGVK